MVSAAAFVDISSDEEDDLPMDKPAHDLPSVVDDGLAAALDALLPMAAEQGNVPVPSGATDGGRCSDSDDDCQILDSDPDKPVLFGAGGGDVDDELAVVGEKGQLACRDFAHPRHLCANFPFSSSPHEKHCGLCHCYICDSPAPCKHWGNGISALDHCHATDKASIWKILRQSSKQGVECSLLQKLQDGLLSGIATSENPLSVNCPNSVQLPAPTQRLSTLQPCSASSFANTYPNNQRLHRRQPTYSFCSQRPGPYPAMAHPPNSRTESVCGHSSLPDELASQSCSGGIHRETQTSNFSIDSLSINQSHPGVLNTNWVSNQMLQNSNSVKVTSGSYKHLGVGSQIPHNSLLTSEARPNHMLLKSNSVNMSSQSYQFPGVGLQNSLLTSPAVSMDQARSSPLRSYSTPARISMLDYSKSWLDILAFAESDLQAPHGNSQIVTVAPQPLAVVQPIPYTQEMSRGVVNQSIPGQATSAVGQVNLLNYPHTCFNSRPIPDTRHSHQGENPNLSTASLPDSIVVHTDSDIGMNGFNSFLPALDWKLV